MCVLGPNQFTQHAHEYRQWSAALWFSRCCNLVSITSSDRTSSGEGETKANGLGAVSALEFNTNLQEAVWDSWGRNSRNSTLVDWRDLSYYCKKGTSWKRKQTRKHSGAKLHFEKWKKPFLSKGRHYAEEEEEEGGLLMGETKW